MTYTVFSSNEGYLKPVSSNVEENLLIHYGEIIRNIYDHYDADRAKPIGYVLSNGFYAMQSGIK